MDKNTMILGVVGIVAAIVITIVLVMPQTKPSASPQTYPYPSGNAPTELCGDGSCNNGEDCQICASDCGECGRVSMSGFGSVKPMDWACDSNTNEVKVIFMNTVGDTITLIGSSAIDCTPTTVPFAKTISCTIPATGSCATVAAGSRYDETITIAYVMASGESRTSTGSVWGAAE